jgi:hypothetical protein
MKIDIRCKSYVQLGGAIVLCAATSALYAQGSPSFKDSPICCGNKKPPVCPELILPTPSTPLKAKNSDPKNAPQLRSKIDTNGGGGGSPPAPSIIPAAVSVWSLTANGKYSYCVQAGAINDEGAPFGTPVTLTLADVRLIDSDYQHDYAAIGQTVPSAHVAAAQKQYVISAPVAVGQTVVPTTWCLSDIDWKKRPHLVLTLTAPASAGGQPAFSKSCEIAPGQKLSKTTDFKPALDSKVKTGKWPVVIRPRGTGIPLEPAKKIDIPKVVAPK